MSRIAYVDGSYRPHRDAAGHIADRGYQFADGVDEAIAVKGGHLVDETLHLARLRRSLDELRIEGAIGDGPLKIVLRKQQAREAGAYEAWQVDALGRVTEGTSPNA